MPSPDAQALIRVIGDFAREVSHWRYPQHYVDTVLRTDALRVLARTNREVTRDAVLARLRAGVAFAREERIDEADASMNAASMAWSSFLRFIDETTNEAQVQEARTVADSSAEALQDFGNGLARVAHDAAVPLAQGALGASVPLLVVGALALFVLARRRGAGRV